MDGMDGAPDSAAETSEDEILSCFLYAPPPRAAIKEIFSQSLECDLPDDYIDDIAGRLASGDAELLEAMSYFAPSIGETRSDVMQAAVLVMMAGEIGPAEQKAIQHIVGGLGLNREETASVFTEMHEALSTEH